MFSSPSIRFPISFYFKFFRFISPYYSVTTPVCGVFIFFPILLALCSTVLRRNGESLNQTFASPALIFIPRLCNPSPLHSTCPWYAKMPPRYVFSSSSSARSSFIIGFLFHYYLLLYYPFIHSQSVPACCCKFSSKLITANVTLCVCALVCFFSPSTLPLTPISPIQTH